MGMEAAIELTRKMQWPLSDRDEKYGDGRSAEERHISTAV